MVLRLITVTFFGFRGGREGLSQPKMSTIILRYCIEPHAGGIIADSIQSSHTLGTRLDCQDGDTVSHPGKKSSSMVILSV